MSNYSEPNLINDSDHDLLYKGAYAAWLLQQSGGGAGIAPSGSNFSIPAFDSQEFSYFAATNNIQTITYKMGGSTVATMTFTYVSGGVADDDLVETMTLS